MPPCWAKAVGANARTVAAAVAITYLWIIGSSLVDASVRHTGDADAGGLDTLIEVDSQCLPADGMCAAAENPTSARPGWGSSQVNLHDFSVHGEHLIGICDMPDVRSMSIGEEPTTVGQAQIDAVDPEATWAAHSCCDAQHTAVRLAMW